MKTYADPKHCIRTRYDTVEKLVKIPLLESWTFLSEAIAQFLNFKFLTAHQCCGAGAGRSQYFLVGAGAGVKM